MKCKKPTILISDDSRMNRELLISMLEDQYEIVETENGAQAVEFLREDASRFSAFLLDIQMPVMDGFDVLAYMNKYGWIEEIPVVIISSEDSSAYMERAYNLGAVDYIPRPFDETVVRRRIHNTILLYSKQRRLTGIVMEQLREKRRGDQLMISILAHIVEFRNGESGLHVMHVHVITQMLLQQLLIKTNQYPLTQKKINLISTASALHDIGKLSIPDAILNKPGRYTAEEFEIMKGHAIAGSEMLRDLPFQSEPLLKVAYEICRWHHERYDGKGYPDGLKGDDIPISAQAVSLADVYDALTSERCYKKAYSHKQALNMILGGQCGIFNPILLSCLQDIESLLEQKLKAKSLSSMEEDEEDNKHIAEQLHRYGLITSEKQLREQEYANQRLRFISDQSDAIFFSYAMESSLLLINKYGAAQLNLDERIENPLDNEAVRDCMTADTLRLFEEKIKKATAEQPDFQLELQHKGALTSRTFHCFCHTIWSGNADSCIAMIAKMADADQTSGSTEKVADSRMWYAAFLKKDDQACGGVSMENAEVRTLLQYLQAFFDTVRLVDPKKNIQITVDETGICRETPYCCYQIWNRTEKCENCISAKCTAGKGRLTKFEFSGKDIYHVRAVYVEIENHPYSLELIDKITDEALMQGLEKDHLIRSIADYRREIYTDPVAGIRNRRYYEEQLKNLEGTYGVAMIDVDHFKAINDTYGHPVGDLALMEVAKNLADCVRKTDAVVRFGGDEFVVVFSEIPPEKFVEKLKQMGDRIKTAVLPDYAQIHLSISVGGIYGSNSISELTAMADDLMYQAKRENRGVMVRLSGGVMVFNESERML